MRNEDELTGVVYSIWYRSESERIIYQFIITKFLSHNICNVENELLIIFSNYKKMYYYNNYDYWTPVNWLLII